MSFLKIKNLSVDYPMRKETVYAAKDVNIEVNKGEILGKDPYASENKQIEQGSVR